MKNLWSSNSPQKFWQCCEQFSDEQWNEALIQSQKTIKFYENLDLDSLLAAILGEAQFGEEHWDLDKSTDLYYLIRKLVPKSLRNNIRKFQKTVAQRNHRLGWPIENRYARFLWEIIIQLLISSQQEFITVKNFWPRDNNFALILTHDIESEKGQAFIQRVADLEEGLGFRSSINFVAEEYPLNHQIISDLRNRGFEIGLHGLQHNNKLFSSKTNFSRQAIKINQILKQLEAVGFRSPSTIRQPEWMQELDIEYDLSFFDTDPWEPISGGTMSIWPFMLGNFVELPYTLVQDNTLVNVLNENTPRLWLEKVNFIEQYHGMALVNSHPDYLIQRNVWNVYEKFLKAMQEKEQYWHALPREAAQWWRCRLNNDTSHSFGPITYRKARMQDGHLLID